MLGLFVSYLLRSQVPWPVGQRPSSSSESLSSHRNQKRSRISFNARKHAVCYMMLYVYICLRYFVKSVMFCGNLVPWRLDSLDLWIWPLIQSLLVPFAAHGRPKLQPGKSAFHHHMLPSMRWLSRTISCQKITNQLERNLSAELARQCSTIWTSSSQDIAILRMSVAKSVLLHRVCRHFGGLECLEVKMSRKVRKRRWTFQDGQKMECRKWFNYKTGSNPTGMRKPSWTLAKLVTDLWALAPMKAPKFNPLALDTTCEIQLRRMTILRSRWKWSDCCAAGRLNRSTQRGIERTPNFLTIARAKLQQLWPTSS